MRGEQLRDAYLTAKGVYGDRRYAFLSTGARKDFPYFTAREQHEMLQYRARYLHPEKMARPNGGLAHADDAIEVETPTGERLGVEDPRLIEVLLGGLRDWQRKRHQVMLVHSDNPVVDTRPLSLFSAVGTAARRKDRREDGQAPLPGECVCRSRLGQRF